MPGVRTSSAQPGLLGPGSREDSLLAMADPYLRWLAPARHAAGDFQWLPASPDIS
jgi:hypothetical protein